MANNNIPYIHRDISWLSFNYRVLQEAKDPGVPLLERIKFLAIFSNNIGEFFKVRVANHRNLLRVGKKTKKELEVDPKKILKEILEIVNIHFEEFSEIFENQIIPELRKVNIKLLTRLDLDEEQQEFVSDYFMDNLLPFVQPVLLVKEKIRPFLNNGALYLTVWLQDRADNRDKFAIIKIPSDHVPRFIKLPSKDRSVHSIIMLDDIVRHSVQQLFPGYFIMDTYSIKLTRDAELYIDDEFSGNLLEKIKKSLKKRNVGSGSRFVFDRDMPAQMLDFLKGTFHLNKYDLIPEGRYHNNFDFFSFPDYGLTHLKNPQMPPLPYATLENTKDFFKEINKRDHLIHVPYHSYESVVRFFEEAAADSNVTHIKIIQYRVAKKSRIMKALMRAVKMGKQVTVFIEVKARFDEEANLEWGEKLEAAGVNVHYSFPGVKVHSKLALIVRRERGRPKLYTYLSTGNFHEDTAKVYSDFGLFTADTRITKEVARVFTFLETVKMPQHAFEHLLVGQFNLREELEDYIDNEIKNAKNGLPASILLKMNSLQDDTMIKKLYEASSAGVKIKMIVRGICCLVPGIKGVSENIEIISIVDRFLEHSRIFVFHNDGNEKVFLSSADWMNRNLSRRIEAAFPIYDEILKEEILETLEIQWNDNVKARIIEGTNSNLYRKKEIGKTIRAQTTTYHYYKKRMEKS